MSQNNTSPSRQQLDEKISRQLMVGMDGDLSNISAEAEDVLASLDGTLFQDNSQSIFTSIGKPKKKKAAPAPTPAPIAEEVVEKVAEQAPAQEFFEELAQEPVEETFEETYQETLEELLPQEPMVFEEEIQPVTIAELTQDVDAPVQEETFEFFQEAPPLPVASDFVDAPEQPEAEAAKPRANKALLCAMALVCAVSIGSIGARFVRESKLLSADTIFGVTMEGVSLEGMTREAARTAIDEIRAAKDTSRTLTLQAGEDTFTTTLDAFSPAYDTQSAHDLAWNVGRKGSRITRLYDIRASRVVTRELHIPCNFDEAAVTAFVADLAEDVDRPVQDAELTFAPVELRESDYPFHVQEEAVGQTLDQEAAVQAIRDCAISGETQIELAVTTQEPTVFLADLQENIQPMRTFTTSYARIANRTFNIHRATDTINGTVLQPGEEFSFNRIVGNTSLAENGYKEAGVIVGGRSSTDRGGGVCQAATTLYNVAVRCDMEITARDPHAIASSYVPRGQDATIAYGHCDLAFINTSDHPIYIVGKYTDTTVTFTMYGRPLEDGITIEMESEHLGTRSPGAAKVTVDPTKPTTYEETVVSALNGYDIRVYKVWFDAEGNEIRRVVDHTDAYPTRRAEIIVGGMEVAAPDPTPDPVPDPVPDPGEGA